MYEAVKYLYPLNMRKKYSYELPNEINISFDMHYFLILGMVLYIPSKPINMNILLTQRFFSILFHPPGELKTGDALSNALFLI